MVENPIKVMIVDDMEAHRRRLEREIVKHPDFQLLPSATSGSEAVLLAAESLPDIILMDIEMEDRFTGINASKQINQTLPNIKIIIFTVHEDDNIVFAAFQTGIVDYIIKTAASDEIMDAIRSAHHNLSPIRPIIAEKIRNEFKKVKSREENLLYLIKLISDVTPAELELLKLIYEGKTSKQLAEARCVEHSTIKKQINSILRKCEHPNTKELVKTLKELMIFEVIKKL